MAGNSNSGRRPAVQEVKYQIKTISQQALVELATSKVLAQLEKLGESPKCLKKVQALALPILLKSIKEHKQVDIVEVKPLLSAIRGEISEPKQLEESLTANASEALKDDQTQYNAITDPITSKEPQPTTQAENEAIMNE